MIWLVDVAGDIFQDMRFQCLLSLMLSSQTKDQVTAAAMSRLIEYGCSVENIASTKEGQIEELIYPVSFYKVFFENTHFS